MTTPTRGTHTETCDYCKGVGACPKCWGRSAITELKTERDELLALVRRLAGTDLPRTASARRSHLTAMQEAKYLLGRLDGRTA